MVKDTSHSAPKNLPGRELEDPQKPSMVGKFYPSMVRWLLFLTSDGSMVKNSI